MKTRKYARRKIFFAVSLYLLSLLVPLITIKAWAQNILDLGIAGDYSALSGQSISASQPIHLLGKAGANSSIDEAVDTESAIDVNGSGDVVHSLAILDLLITIADSLTGIAIPEDLNDQTLTSGAYTIYGYAFIHGGSLRFVGTDTSIYIINIFGNLLIKK